jgi:hypothetical protein
MNAISKAHCRAHAISVESSYASVDKSAAAMWEIFSYPRPSFFRDSRFQHCSHGRFGRTSFQVFGLHPVWLTPA